MDEENPTVKFDLRDLRKDTLGQAGDQDIKFIRQKKKLDLSDHIPPFQI